MFGGLAVRPAVALSCAARAERKQQLVVTEGFTCSQPDMTSIGFNSVDPRAHAQVDARLRVSSS